MGRVIFSLKFKKESAIYKYWKPLFWIAGVAHHRTE